MARTANPTTKPAQQPEPRKRLSRGAIIGIAVAVVAIGAIAAVEANTQGYVTGGFPVYQPVGVAGGGLPPYNGTGADAAVGVEAPVLTGKDWTGKAVSTAPNGKPSLIVFVTHWCPHCQADVPRLQAAASAGEVPAGINVYSVATGTDETRPNFPPTQWLINAGWTFPTIMDDQANTASTAFGLTSYPYWVVLDADGKVVTRLSGELDDSAIKQLLDGIASGNSTATTVAAGDSSNVGSGTTVAPSTTAAG